MTSWVLMYHRVCARTNATEPWFARGTAVTPEAFTAQMDWLDARYDIVSLEEVCRPRPRGRPRAALTFDDGYEEVGAGVFDVCSQRGMPATCFATAEPAMTGQPLWVDAWYAVLAKGPAESVRRCLRDWGAPEVAEHEDWVRGSVRKWLATLPADLRRERLGALLALAGSPPTPRYLTIPSLRRLADHGWMIGGHGRVHARLTDIGDAELNDELDASRALLAAIRVDPVAFAYADGAHDERVVRAACAAGFQLGCTVEPGPVMLGGDLLRIPRVFCRGGSEVPHPLLLGPT